jgi:alpha-glucosidase
MGALIATYGVCEYPNLFRKLCSFSPAYWFVLDDLNSYLNTPIDLSNHRSYFVAGQNESSTMVTNTNSIKNAMQNNGMTSDNTLTKFDSYGTHCESYWRGEFGAAYQWLFLDENLSVETISPVKPTIIQTLSGKFWVEGFEENTTFELFALSGQKITTLQLENGFNSLPEDLASGIYILKSEMICKKLVKM